MMATNQDDRLASLERQVRRQRACLVALALAGGAAVSIAATSGTPSVIDARAIRIIDAAGKPRILIGAPPPPEGRLRKDAQTASIVVLGPNGRDRVIIGENPGPVINGKTYPRIAPTYGLIIHDSNGDERGGVNYLDNGRGVIALDRPGADAVAMIVNERSGFAGLTVNYAPAATGQYVEGVRIGTQGNEAWYSLRDRETERARLSTDGAQPFVWTAQPTKK